MQNMLNSIDSFHYIMLITMVNNLVYKVPLIWVMKGSYFSFGGPQQQVDMHARSNFFFNFLMHLFFTLFAYQLPNDFLNDSFSQTPPE